jgi:hypothetical protein
MKMQVKKIDGKPYIVGEDPDTGHAFTHTLAWAKSLLASVTFKRHRPEQAAYTEEAARMIAKGETGPVRPKNK